MAEYKEHRQVGKTMMTTVKFMIDLLRDLGFNDEEIRELLNILFKDD